MGYRKKGGCRKKSCKKRIENSWENVHLIPLVAAVYPVCVTMKFLLHSQIAAK